MASEGPRGSPDAPGFGLGVQERRQEWPGLLDLAKVGGGGAQDTGVGGWPDSVTWAWFPVELAGRPGAHQGVSG